MKVSLKTVLEEASSNTKTANQPNKSFYDFFMSYEQEDYKGILKLSVKKS